MQAVILAGGKGLRFRPYTTVIPKPLIPVGDYPILEIIIKQLKNHNFKDIVISTGHLAELIYAYFGKGKKWGVNIKYIYETKPLNTAGALKLIKKLDNDFLVINGDILCDLNYKKFFNYHLKNKSIATISVKRQKTTIDFGIVTIDKNSILMDYTEKPEYEILVSMGIYVLNKKCIRYIKKDEVIGMPDLMKRLKENNENICCKIFDGFWLDIGKTEDHQIATDLVLAGEIKI